jgi:hypothetical protein
MGIERKSFDAGLEGLNNARGTETQQEATTATRGTVATLGLSGADSLLIGNYGENEVLEAFAEVCSKALKSAKIKVVPLKIDLMKFDLGFSHMLFGFKGDNGKAYYFSALLEATGRKPLDVRTILDSLNVKNSSDVLVTADAFDKDFFDVATSVVSRAFSVDENNIVFCQGVIIPTGADIEQTGDIVAKYAQDIIVSNYAKDTGMEADVTVAAINEVMGNGMLNLDLAFNSGSTINMLGRHIRTDFNVEVSIIKNNNIRSLNGQGGRRKLSTTAGMIDYIIAEETNHYTGQIKRMAEPMIILNEFIGSAPTINYALASLINATTFTNRNILKTLIVEKDAGPLNFMFNYGGAEGSIYGEKISFKDEGADPTVINDIIRNHIKPEPIFAMDIEEYGSDYPYLRPFSALAVNASRRLANEDILAAACEFTGVELPNMDVAVGTIHVPLGEFQDSDGNVRDIREIDTVFIAKHINEPSILINWIYSNTPADVCLESTGKDPYILKLEVIDKVAAMLNIKPVITGRAIRIILNGEFISQLVSAAMGSGYAPKVDAPNIGYNDFNNLQNIASAYASAAVSNTGFGATGARQGYQVPYTQYNRYGR